MHLLGYLYEGYDTHVVSVVFFPLLLSESSLLIFYGIAQYQYLASGF